MRQLVLRWSMWFSLLAFACLTTGGTWRYLSPPAAKVPLESLVRMPPHMEAVPERDPMLLAARAGLAASYGGSGTMYWPTRLPSGSVLSESGQFGYLSALAWTAEGDWWQRPLLRLRHEYGKRLLPDLPEVMVRGQVGRAGQISGDDCPPQPHAVSACTYSGVWWLQEGVIMKLSSATLSTAELVEIAESLEPLIPAGPIPYQRKTVTQGGYAIAVAGSESNFPVPSVTYLPEIDVYLVRTLAGYGAFYGRESRYGRPITWDASRSRFHDSREASQFTMLGRCMFGPCFGDLSRYAVRIQGDKVLIDLGTRYIEHWRRDSRPPLPAWAPAWP